MCLRKKYLDLSDDYKLRNGLQLADDDIIRGGLDIVTDKKNRRQSKKPPSLRLRGLKNAELYFTIVAFLARLFPFNVIS